MYAPSHASVRGHSILMCCAAYIFWTIFTSLIPTLFYFSIWELGIAGTEAALFSTLSPALLSNPTFLWMAKTKAGQTTLHFFSFAGLAAYAWERPIHRLLIVAPATSLAVVRQVVAWSGEDVRYQSIGKFVPDSVTKSSSEKIPPVTALGFIVSTLSKHANHSNNPGRWLLSMKTPL